MQIVIAAFGRAVDMTVTWHGKTSSDTDNTVVILDSATLELADDDEPQPFGFTLQCPER